MHSIALFLDDASGKDSIPPPYAGLRGRMLRRESVNVPAPW